MFFLRNAIDSTLFVEWNEFFLKKIFVLYNASRNINDCFVRNNVQTCVPLGHTSNTLVWLALALDQSAIQLHFLAATLAQNCLCWELCREEVRREEVRRDKTKPPLDENLRGFA